MLDDGNIRVFHFNACLRFLFKSWEVATIGDLVGSVSIVYILAILYEGLKSLRHFLSYHEELYQKGNVEDRTEDNEEKESTSDDDDRRRRKLLGVELRPWLLHAVQSLIQVLQIGYAYILMYAAMTFNGWLFLSVCFGMGTGYFFFTKTKWLKFSTK